MLCFMRFLDHDCDGFITEDDFCRSVLSWTLLQKESERMHEGAMALARGVTQEMAHRWDVAAQHQAAELAPHSAAAGRWQVLRELVTHNKAVEMRSRRIYAMDESYRLRRRPSGMVAWQAIERSLDLIFQPNATF